MLLLTRIPIQSSMLQALGYDPDSHTLFVVFREGKAWMYQGLDESVFEALLGSSSKGGYMHRHIIGVYPNQEVQEGIDFKWKASH